MANLQSCINNLIVIIINVWNQITQNELFQLVLAMSVYRAFICPIIDKMRNKFH